MTDGSCPQPREGSLDEALRSTFPASDAFALARAPMREPGPRPAQIAHLNRVLANLFALYVATKGCHWHASGPHFHDHHRLFDAQATELLATIDPVAERVRKLGAGTISSLWNVEMLATRRYPPLCTPQDTLRWLLEENRTLADLLREAHALSASAGDIASVGLLEEWIDQAEGRIWFLFEASSSDQR